MRMLACTMPSWEPASRGTLPRLLKLCTQLTWLRHRRACAQAEDDGHMSCTHHDGKRWRFQGGVYGEAQPCCSHLYECIEARDVADPYHPDYPGNEGCTVGKDCWYTWTICRDKCRAPSPPPSPGAPSPPTCIYRDEFNPGYGFCPTYAYGRENMYYCDSDEANCSGHNVKAYEACSECGQCTDASATRTTQADTELASSTQSIHHPKRKGAREIREAWARKHPTYFADHGAEGA